MTLVRFVEIKVENVLTCSFDLLFEEKNMKYGLACFFLCNFVLRVNQI